MREASVEEATVGMETMEMVGVAAAGRAALPVVEASRAAVAATAGAAIAVAAGAAATVARGAVAAGEAWAEVAVSGKG